MLARHRTASPRKALRTELGLDRSTMAVVEDGVVFSSLLAGLLSTFVALGT